MWCRYERDCVACWGCCVGTGQHLCVVGPVGGACIERVVVVVLLLLFVCCYSCNSSLLTNTHTKQQPMHPYTHITHTCTARQSAPTGIQPPAAPTSTLSCTTSVNCTMSIMRPSLIAGGTAWLVAGVGEEEEDCGWDVQRNT